MSDVWEAKSEEALEAKKEAWEVKNEASESNSEVWESQSDAREAKSEAWEAKTDDGRRRQRWLGHLLIRERFRQR
jgi:hypothetical protein